MSNKKLKRVGFMPLDFIGNDSLAEIRRGREAHRSRTSGGSKKYRLRQDPDVLEKVNRGLKEGGIWPSSEGSNAREDHVNGNGGQGTMESVNTSGNSRAKISYLGQLRVYDVEGRSNDKCQSMMTLISDSSGPRVSFTLDRMENKEAQIDIGKDCARLLCEEGNTSVGFVLREPRLLRLDSRVKSSSEEFNELPRSTGLIFICNDTSSFKEVLKASKVCKTLDLPDQRALVDKLLESATLEQDHGKGQAPVKDSRSFFPHKSNFQSIDFRKKSRSSSESAHPIGLSSSPGRSSSIPVPRVSADTFYRGRGGLQKHAFSKVETMRQTRSQTPELVQKTLWNVDDETEHEIPEKFEPQLCYKFDDGASYTITNQDFKCLYNHDWINDTILDFFTKFYAEKAVRNLIITSEEVHIMSSFFYTKLVSDPADYYQNVKKWVSNSNLFRKKYVVVPININFHWFGCVITNLDSLLKFFEELSEAEKAKLTSKAVNKSVPNRLTRSKEEPHLNDIVSRLSSRNNTPSTTEDDDDEISISVPVVKILTFDSLRQTHSREIDPLKDFLIAYAKDQYSLDLEKNLIKMKTCAVPQQPNLSDCGVHVILNTMKFFENPPQTIEVWRSAKSRSKSSTKVINEYFEKKKRNSARRDLRDTLWSLQKEQIRQRNANKASTEDKVGINIGEEEDGDIEIIEELTRSSPTLPQLKNPSDDRQNTSEMKQLQPSEAQTILVESFTQTTDSQCSPEVLTKVDEGRTLDKSQLSSQDEGVSMSTVTGTSVAPVPARRFLESSPAKSSDDGILPGITSPYFSTTSSKNRRTTLDDSMISGLMPSRISKSSVVYKANKQRRTSPSAPISEESISDGDMSGLSVAVEMRDRYVGTSASPSTHGDTINLSDHTQYDDVNLVGYEENGDADRLEQVRRSVESELANGDGDLLDERAGSEKHQMTFISSARNATRRKPSPNDSDSDLVDTLRTDI